MSGVGKTTEAKEKQTMCHRIALKLLADLENHREEINQKEDSETKSKTLFLLSEQEKSLKALLPNK